MTAPLVRRSPTHTGRVVGTASVTPRMRRVTVQADSMIGVQILPAQDVELHLVDGTGRRVKRRYTIRAARPVVGELDLDVQQHGAGPGAEWGASATVGDAIAFQGPRGKLQMTAADWHLLVGDESALPAIAVIASWLHAGERAISVIEVRDGDDEQPVLGEVHWAHRGDAPVGTPDQILPVVEALTDVQSLGSASSVGHAYLLGETRSMVAARALLESRGLPHDAIFLKGYWNIGRPDRISGRRPSA